MREIKRRRVIHHPPSLKTTGLKNHISKLFDEGRTNGKTYKDFVDAYNDETMSISAIGDLFGHKSWITTKSWVVQHEHELEQKAKKEVVTDDTIK